MSFFVRLFLLTALWAAASFSRTCYAQPLHAQPLPDSLSDTARAAPFTRLLTRNALFEAGVTRLSELFDVLEDSYALTRDGFTYNAALAALAAPQQSTYTVLLDGQPVDVRLLGLPRLNALPVHVDQLAYVEVQSTPQIAAGMFAPGGTIHLHTQPPAGSLRGRPDREGGGTLGVRLAASAGNETGDPGPYRYTRFATLNVDRIGPTYGAEASYGRPARYARLSVTGVNQYANDLRIRPRFALFSDLSGGPAAFAALAPRLTAGLTGPLGQHALDVSYTYLADYSFIEPLGAEVPTLRTHARAALRGALTPGAPRGLRYRLSAERLAFSPAANNPADLRFDWKQDRLRGAVAWYDKALRLAGRPAQATLGLSADVYRSRTGVSLADPSLSAARLYGTVRLQPAPRWQQQLGVAAGLTDGAADLSATAATRVQPGAAHTLDLALSAAQQPFAATNSPWHWSAEGYAFPRALTDALRLPRDFAAARALTADLGWTVRLAERLTLHTRGSARAFRGATLARTTYGPDDAVATRVATNLRGHTYRAKASAQWRLPFLRQRLTYAFQSFMTGDDAFAAAWRPVPRSLARYTARFAPNERFSLQARLTYRGATTWPQYDAGAAPGGPYPARLPTTWLLDLTAQKRFWDDHLRASLALRNVFDEPERSHAAGPVTQLTLFVSVAAQL